MLSCVFCGDSAEYQRDYGPYRLTPYCLECVEPLGVNALAVVGHLVDPEIEYRFYCQQPEKLPPVLCGTVFTKPGFAGGMWASDNTYLTDLNGYMGKWYDKKQTNGVKLYDESVVNPSFIDWTRALRPPRSGDLWLTQRGEVIVKRDMGMGFREPGESIVQSAFACIRPQGQDTFFLVLNQFIRPILTPNIRKRAEQKDDRRILKPMLLGKSLAEKRRESAHSLMTAKFKSKY